ncbi:hypothetical protein DY000_02023793 [Brassica cretica]|uniref:Uncharacterized protein n=1 Tax=Brassica cretica TaxID=69181 RepID=A0ABQ7EJB1_BRACR|nr:hypothetical protein DY000_02023793 [Brassica cretica]
MDEEDELGGWDDFLDAAFKAEEIFLSTQVPPPAPPIVPPPLPASESVELIRTRVFVFRSPVQQHDFNFTYQLESGSNRDLPSSGQVFTVVVDPGGFWKRDNSWNRRIVRQPVQQRDHGHSGSSGESWNKSSGDSTKDCSFGEAKSTGQEQTNSILYGSARCWIQILWRWSQDTHVTTKKRVACDTNEQQSDPISVPGHVRLNVAAPRIKMLFD